MPLKEESKLARAAEASEETSLALAEARVAELTEAAEAAEARAAELTEALEAAEASFAELTAAAEARVAELTEAAEAAEAAEARAAELIAAAEAAEARVAELTEAAKARAAELIAAAVEAAEARAAASGDGAGAASEDAAGSGLLSAHLPSGGFWRGEWTMSGINTILPIVFAGTDTFVGHSVMVKPEDTTDLLGAISAAKDSRAEKSVIPILYFQGDGQNHWLGIVLHSQGSTTVATYFDPEGQSPVKEVVFALNAAGFDSISIGSGPRQTCNDTCGEEMIFAVAAALGVPLGHVSDAPYKLSNLLAASLTSAPNADVSPPDINKALLSYQPSPVSMSIESMQTWLISTIQAMVDAIFPAEQTDEDQARLFVLINALEHLTSLDNPLFGGIPLPDGGSDDFGGGGGSNEHNPNSGNDGLFVPGGNSSYIQNISSVGNLDDIKEW
jgi:hypothetical protein